MLDCKPLTAFMATNKKLSKNDGREKVDESIHRSLVGSLIYLTNTQPNTVHTVSIVSRFMSEPNSVHFTVAKRIVRYIKGTKIYGILYEMEKESILIRYRQ